MNNADRKTVQNPECTDFKFQKIISGGRSTDLDLLFENRNENKASLYGNVFFFYYNIIISCMF